MPSLLDQIREALVAFTRLQTPPALIGGLALSSHNFVRDTRDVDFLVDADDADHLHGLLLELGYHCPSQRGRGQLSARRGRSRPSVRAHRPIAGSCWRLPMNRITPMGRLRVVTPKR